MDCCLGGLRSGSRWNGTSGIKGCMASMFRVRISAQCNRCMHICAICTMYAVCFHVTILVLPGISSDILDGFLIA